MILDTVHDLQKAYRTILGCAAEPGSVADASMIIEKLDVDCPVNKAFLLIGLVLLDAETSCSIVPDSHGDALSFFSHMTYTKKAPPEEASFLFLPDDGSIDADTLAALVLHARRGTLVDPHLGATIVLETSRLSWDKSDGTPATPWILTGPGLRGNAALNLPADDGGRTHAVMEARTEACSEYPLGVDLILVDRQGWLAYIPRSIQSVEA